MNDSAVFYPHNDPNAPPRSVLLLQPTSMVSPPFMDVEEVDSHHCFPVEDVGLTYLSYQLEIDCNFLDVFVSVSGFEVDDWVVFAKEPVRLQVEQDEVGRFLVEDESFGIYLVSDTLEELDRDVHEVFKFLWRQYAMEKEDALSNDAVSLKHKLLKSFESTG